MEYANKNKEIPAELKRWNWGAFLFNWIWGVGNNTYRAFKVFIPIYGIYYMFVLGIKGNEWAWENARWDSVDHFKRVQRNWAIAALAYIAIMVLVCLPVLFIVPAMFKNSGPYVLSMQILEQSQSFQNNVGLPYTSGFVTGNLSTSGHQGNANMSFTVEGTAGKAELYLKASRDMGEWSVDCIKARYLTTSDVEYIGQCKQER